MPARSNTQTSNNPNDTEEELIFEGGKLISHLRLTDAEDLLTGIQFGKNLLANTIRRKLTNRMKAIQRMLQTVDNIVQKSQTFMNAISDDLAGAVIAVARDSMSPFPAAIRQGFAVKPERKTSELKTDIEAEPALKLTDETLTETIVSLGSHMVGLLSPEHAKIIVDAIKTAETPLAHVLRKKLRMHATEIQSLISSLDLAVVECQELLARAPVEVVESMLSLIQESQNMFSTLIRGRLSDLLEYQQKAVGGHGAGLELSQETPSVSRDVERENDVIESFQMDKLDHLLDQGRRTISVLPAEQAAQIMEKIRSIQNPLVKVIRHKLAQHKTDLDDILEGVEQALVGHDENADPPPADAPVLVSDMNSPALPSAADDSRTVEDPSPMDLEYQVYSAATIRDETAQATGSPERLEGAHADGPERHRSVADAPSGFCDPAAAPADTTATEDEAGRGVVAPNPGSGGLDGAAPCEDRAGPDQAAVPTPVARQSSGQGRLGDMAASGSSSGSPGRIKDAIGAGRRLMGLVPALDCAGVVSAMRSADVELSAALRRGLVQQAGDVTELLATVQLALVRARPLMGRLAAAEAEAVREAAMSPSNVCPAAAIRWGGRMLDSAVAPSPPTQSPPTQSPPTQSPPTQSPPTQSPPIQSAQRAATPPVPHLVLDSSGPGETRCEEPPGAGSGKGAPSPFRAPEETKAVSVAAEDAARAVEEVEPVETGDATEGAQHGLVAAGREPASPPAQTSAESLADDAGQGLGAEGGSATTCMLPLNDGQVKESVPAPGEWVADTTPDGEVSAVCSTRGAEAATEEGGEASPDPGATCAQTAREESATPSAQDRPLSRGSSSGLGQDALGRTAGTGASMADTVAFDVELLPDADTGDGRDEVLQRGEVLVHLLGGPEAEALLKQLGRGSGALARSLARRLASGEVVQTADDSEAGYYVDYEAVVNDGIVATAGDKDYLEQVSPFVLFSERTFAAFRNSLPFFFPEKSLFLGP